MKKILLVLSVFGLFALAACSSLAPYDLETETELIVGMEAAYAPFNWMETEATEYNYPLAGSNNYVAGYDVEVAKAIASALGKTLVIKAIDWDGLIVALKAGEIDLIIAGMSPTEERKKQISFTEEYYRSEIVMVVSANGNYANATSLADFNGARVVAQQGTIYDDLIASQITGAIHNQPLGNYGELTLSVTSGVADAFIAEYPVAQSIVTTEGRLKIIELENGGFDMEEADVVVSIGARKQDTDLVEAINEVLSKISQDTRNEWMLTAVTNSNN
ncbi:transporter substrate-binding domain-containing protein [Acholeplasma hippikon]|uniref:Arginine-binding extracellular protein ArtP n=1 Tax=Acholeplasma hippikon TaxID=264636 RepID=A0A449BIN6_9MOLU|nr:transporter substrate-binding domain-containing protein [Acholeplasma hippikon]VEU82319.1 Arginine-binding extracellular protein ArtP precursor [Acholeplasma hippikon]